MLFLSFICAIIACDSLFNLPIVTIPTFGKVLGSRMITANGRSFLSFRGIPYAKPPVNQLRFRDPEPVDPWKNRILDATRDGPMCIQYSISFDVVMGREDCLKLSVYTHSKDSNHLKPVMVYIHGGAWFLGSGSGLADIYGPRLFLDRDIVLVTLNYRLGPLGFFTTEDAEAPGNYGLLDQTLALKWVKDNIRHFGGDPNLVTIFGASAGAVSVQHHLLSPLSKGLFHRAIMESGSSLNPWAIQNLSIGTYCKELATKLKCTSSKSSDVLACLQKKSAKSIVAYQRDKDEAVMSGFPVAFGPRIDIERTSPFIPAHPRTLMEDRNRTNAVPVIMGLNKNEAAMHVAGLRANNGAYLKKFSENPTKYISYLMGTEYAKNDERNASQIVGHFSFLSDSLTNQLPQLEQLFSDLTFNKGVDDSVRLFSKNSSQSVYYYLYTHRGLYSLADILFPFSGQYLGVGHGDQLLMMFSNNLIASLPRTRSDIKVSNIFLDLWTSFAKNGVPQSKLLSSDWIPVESTQMRYLNIANTPLMVSQSMPFYNRLVSYWNTIFGSARNTDETEVVPHQLNN